MDDKNDILDTAARSARTRIEGVAVPFATDAPDVFGSSNDSSSSNDTQEQEHALRNGHVYDLYGPAKSVEQAELDLALGRSLFASFQSTSRLEVSRDNDLAYLQSRGWSAHAYAAAMKNKVSWNSVIDSLCCMALANIPPLWQIKLLHGTGGTLNTYSGVSGESGDGKNTAMGIAGGKRVSGDVWFSFPAMGRMTPLLDEKIKSTPAIPLMYTASTKQETQSQTETKSKTGMMSASNSGIARTAAAAALMDNNSDNSTEPISEWTQRRYSAVLKFTEIGTLTRMLKEESAVAMLCEAWSGDKIGGRVQDTARYGATVEAGRYRFVAVFGVQPGNASTFLDHDVTGLAQRILWVPVSSLTMTPKQVELEYDMFSKADATTWSFPGMPGLSGFGPGEEARAHKALVDLENAITADAFRGVTMSGEVERLAQYLMTSKQARTREVKPIDSHWTLMLLKQAVAEAYLEGWHGRDYPNVEMSDVHRAHYRMLCHETTRAHADATAVRRKQRTAKQTGMLRGIEQDSAKQTMKNREEGRSTLFSAKCEIVRRLWTAESTAIPLPKSGAIGPEEDKQMGSRMKEAWQTAISQLEEQGIIVSGGSVKAKNGAEMLLYSLLRDTVPDTLLRDVSNQ